MDDKKKNQKPLTIDLSFEEAMKKIAKAPKPPEKKKGTSK